MSKNSEDRSEPEHLFDQADGVAGVTSERDNRSDIDRAAQRARGAALGATGAVGWGR